MTEQGGKGKVVTVRMLDSESHRFGGPDTNAVHLRKGQLVEVPKELAERWVRIGLAEKVRKKKAAPKESAEEKGGEE